MRTRYTWGELLPLDETRLAAAYLVETWKKISEAQKGRLRFGQREPQLTERLHSALRDKIAGATELTGFWVNEPQNTYFDSDGRPIHRTRKDVVYQSNLNAPRLSLVFEFKKLGKRSAYRGIDGMGRFIDGNYALGEPLAVMVGIVCNDPKAEAIIESLQASLLDKLVQSALKMVADGNGRYVRIPSDPLVDSAAFDTEHRRPAGKGHPRTNTTTLAHVFLRCRA